MIPTALETSLFDQELATEGLEPYFLDHLKTKISRENAVIVAHYTASMRIETNLSDNHRRDVITSLKLLSAFLVNKPFIKMTREDILLYLDTIRKPAVSDRLHRWVSTYNHRLITFLRFFKWLYHRDMKPSKREKPLVVGNIPTLKRTEKSSYRRFDLWTDEDHIVFLRYSVNKRDRCYHAMAVDTSCRPKEILALRIKDVVFKTAGDHQYAEVIVNGKTGNRVIPLYNSIPFLKDWIEDDPQGRNPSAILFCGLGNRIGRQLSRYAIYEIYEHYRKKFFPSLLEDPNVPRQDKEQFLKLIKKPFNPYILRHSALTQKAKVLKEHVLRQHAGWAINSKMPQIYIHWFGNESSDTLLELYGVKKYDEPLDKGMSQLQRV
ncbi:MAG: site-specific integrase [Thaumarchaeota archaeon]|nr:MAG: site-specific integrase [Nitrososphaerota archaeon]TLX88449.1 MAG: site-specific integrase [Nitrososphaerota archaeon]